MLGRFLIISLLFISLSASAQGVHEQIQSTQSKIKQLEGDIAGYERDLTKTQKERNTLANAVKTLDLSKKKLDAQVELTQNKIIATSALIEELTGKIDAHTVQINRRLASIGESIRNVSEMLGQNAVEIVLSNNTLSATLDNIYSLERLQENIRADVLELKNERTELTSDKKESETARAELLNLKSRLSDQRTLVLSNQKTKQTLLEQTKNKESNYKTLLQEKITLKQKFEQELRSYEASLRQEIDLSKLPHPGSGVLKWPLDNVTITQYFGNTEFAKSGAYKGSGHNGVDFRATLGTTITSAGRGTVRATGNTDIGCQGGSYGQWVLIDHDSNLAGLSTLYSHLSLIKVSAGDTLGAGDLIGYSGQTGYATGPHLHFGVYAKEGVRVTRLIRSDGTASKCTEMPVSPLNGYLNPLLYL